MALLAPADLAVIAPSVIGRAARWCTRTGRSAGVVAPASISSGGKAPDLRSPAVPEGEGREFHTHPLLFTPPPTPCGRGDLQPGASREISHPPGPGALPRSPARLRPDARGPPPKQRRARATSRNKRQGRHAVASQLLQEAFWGWDSAGPPLVGMLAARIQPGDPPGPALAPPPGPADAGEEEGEEEAEAALALGRLLRDFLDPTGPKIGLAGLYLPLALNAPQRRVDVSMFALELFSLASGLLIFVAQGLKGGMQDGEGPAAEACVMLADLSTFTFFICILMSFQVVILVINGAARTAAAPGGPPGGGRSGLTRATRPDGGVAGVRVLLHDDDEHALPPDVCRLLPTPRRRDREVLHVWGAEGGGVGPGGLPHRARGGVVGVERQPFDEVVRPHHGQSAELVSAPTAPPSTSTACATGPRRRGPSTRLPSSEGASRRFRRTSTAAWCGPRRKGGWRARCESRERNFSRLHQRAGAPQAGRHSTRQGKTTQRGAGCCCSFRLRRLSTAA